MSQLVTSINIDSISLSQMNKVDLKVYEMMGDVNDFVKQKSCTEEKLMSLIISKIQEANQMAINVQGTKVSGTYGIKNQEEIIEIHNVNRKNSHFIDIELIY